METTIYCPKCHFAVQSSTPSSQSHCPACGIRIACPKCGSGLEMATEKTDSLFCSTCGEMVTGEDTVPAWTVSQAQSSELPVTTNQVPTLHLAGFQLLCKVGEGGMGVVYRARQISMNRDVAVKVLKPNLASSPRLLELFRNEAETAGRLTDSHILPVFDVLDAGGAPALILPYIEGTDLKKIVAQRIATREGNRRANFHAWATLSDREYLGCVLPILDQLIDAVTAMHAADVLHRDIKPSNVLVDQRGNAWLADFGLARLGTNGLGRRGGIMGTHGYISPEQFAGDTEVDQRGDLFALGVTLYQTLTLTLPFGTAGARPSQALPAPPSRHQRMLSRDLDAVVLKALEPDRQERYASASELKEDWRLARQGLLPKARRLGIVGRLSRRIRHHIWPVTAGLSLLALVGMLAYLPHAQAPQTAAAGPNRTVRIVTDPPGARVVLVPVDEEPYDYTDGEPLADEAIRTDPEATTPLLIPNVPPGTYLVVAQLPDHSFHEVYRTVPPLGAAPSGPFPHLMWSEQEDLTVELSPIQIPPHLAPPPDMCRFQQAEFMLGTESPRPVALIAPPCIGSVDSFFLDMHEVTIAAYHETMKILPPQLRKLDRAEVGEHAVSYVSYDEALAYAEKVGKRLPSEIEYEFAATSGGTQSFPWGADASLITEWNIETIGQPTWDRTTTEPPITGLYSGVAEWTSSMLRPYRSVSILPIFPANLQAEWRMARVVRGGPWPVVIGVHTPAEWYYGPRWRHAVTRTDRYPGLGFRCARTEHARFFSDP